MQRAFWVIVGLVLLVGMVGFFSTVMATQPDPEHKVWICHRTAAPDDVNPYNLIEIDEAALDTHLNNGQGHPAKTNDDGSPRNDFLAPEGATEDSDCVQGTSSPSASPSVSPSTSPSTSPSASPSESPSDTPEPSVPATPPGTGNVTGPTPVPDVPNTAMTSGSTVLLATWLAAGFIVALIALAGIWTRTKRM